MPSVGAFEAMTHLAAQLDAVSAGEQITIARQLQFNQGHSLGGSASPSCAIRGADERPGIVRRHCGERQRSGVLDVSPSWA